MQRKIFSLFLTLLLVGALAALAQSPTTSAPGGGSETKEPYGATLDHPNPGSAPGATGQAYDKDRVNEGQTPATGKTTVDTPPATTTTTTTTPSTSTYNSSTTTSDNMATGTTGSAPSTSGHRRHLPRTASDLPLLAIIGLLALGGALMVRSIARRDDI